MDFGLSEEQESLQRSAREFLEKECPPTLVREIAGETDGFSSRLHRQMAELGWTGLVIPEDLGGLGLGMLEVALLLEEIGRAAVPSPLLSSSVLAALALKRAPAPLKKRWLPAIASGEAVGTVALVESSDRIDSAGITTRARRMKGEYELDGVKMFVSDAAAADFLIVPMRTSGKGDDGVTLFLVPRDAPGIELQSLESIDMTRRAYEVTFRRVRVPASSVIGSEGKAWAVVRHLHDAGALGIAADSLGGAQKALELSVEYSKVRTQFGKPIGSFQALKHMAAEMVAAIEPARSLVWYAAHSLDAAPRQAPRAIAMAKARLSDVYTDVADRAVQMHGGIGFTWEHDLHFWFKRAAWNRVAFGDPAFHRERLAESF